MKVTPALLTLAALLELIDEARNAELCRDIETLREILRPVWSDIETLPDYSHFETAVAAELLRLSGVFMSFYGLAKNLKDYQLKGKDLLTNAVAEFQKIPLPEKAAEANVNLSFCYWNLDEVANAEAILEIVENDFGKNLLNPIYLQICVNRLMICYHKNSRESIEQGLKLINEIKTPMEFCSDSRLQGMFHTQAGILFTNNGEYEKGVFHHNEAIRFAEKANNRMYVGMNLNNLAFLYKEINDFKQAGDCADAAINKFVEIGHRTLLAHTLDTKALIFLEWHKPGQALETINEALEIFQKGEDFRGWTAALWTKIKILLKLRRSSSALMLFGELQQIAFEKIGETAARKFTENLSQEIYFLSGKSYSEEVQIFKRERIGAALITARGKIGKAAEILELKSHRQLSEILEKQFPDLRAQLGFERRARRNSKKQTARIKQPHKVTLQTKDIFFQSEIYPIALGDKQMVFSFNAPSERIEPFYFDKFAMRQFGIANGAVVAIAAVSELQNGMFILVSRGDNFLVSKVVHDKTCNVFVMHDERGEPFFPDDSELIGELIGYCPFSEAGTKYIEFARLKIK